MTAMRRVSLRCARLVVAASAFAALPADAVDADSGAMFQRLRHLRSAEPTVFAAYVLSQLREVSEIAAACGWAANGVIDATVDRVIVHLDTHLAANDVTAAQLRRRGIDAADPVAGRPVAGTAADLAVVACEREGRHYRDWVILGEVAGQPAAPLPTTPSLEALVAKTTDGARSRAAFAAGATLVTVAERAAACGTAPFPRAQEFEETVTRAAETLLRGWGDPTAVAAGLARLLGSERVRSEQFEASRLPCSDPRVRADWQLWEPLAHATPNLVELALAVRPAFTARVAAVRAAACASPAPAAAAGATAGQGPPSTSPPIALSAVVAAKTRQVAESRAFAQAVEAHAHAGGCPPVTGRR